MWHALELDQMYCFAYVKQVMSNYWLAWYIGLALISSNMCINHYTQLHVYFIRSIFFVLNLFTGITVLLSLTVFMLLVAEIMPATSDSIPLIGKACMWVRLFASLCCLQCFCIPASHAFHLQSDLHTHTEPSEYISVHLSLWTLTSRNHL